MNAVAAARLLRRVPSAPFSGSQYKTTVTTTTDETTSTFTSIDVGTPHPDRLVVLACHHGVNAAPSGATVAGLAAYLIVTINEFTVFAVRVPNNVTTTTITVSAASSIRKAVSVYVCYPCNRIPLDFGTGSGTTTTNAVITNLEVQAGGCLIYAGGQHATLGAFTTTWSGVNAVVENVDAQYESASSYTMGHIQITESTTQSDLTLAETVSGTKRLAAVTFRAPWGLGTT